MFRNPVTSLACLCCTASSALCSRALSLRKHQSYPECSTFCCAGGAASAGSSWSWPLSLIESISCAHAMMQHCLFVKAQHGQQA